MTGRGRARRGSQLIRGARWRSQENGSYSILVDSKRSSRRHTAARSASKLSVQWAERATNWDNLAATVRVALAVAVAQTPDSDSDSDSDSVGRMAHWVVAAPARVGARRERVPLGAAHQPHLKTETRALRMSSHWRWRSDRIGGRSISSRDASLSANAHMARAVAAIEAESPSSRAERATVQRTRHQRARQWRRRQ